MSYKRGPMMWKTKDGRWIEIYKMSHQHLINTYRIMLRYPTWRVSQRKVVEAEIAARLGSGRYVDMRKVTPEVYY